ncbi:MAG: hypothetical protein J0H63_02270, partial [Rhizobiales bacterium]|nr:hypothetical protein [Hyphomicrobiales bacterium]
MRDEEDNSLRIAKLPHQPRKPAHLALAERRRRLVENQHCRIAFDRAHDLDHLALAERQIAHARGGRDVELIPFEDFARFADGAAAVDAEPAV